MKIESAQYSHNRVGFPGVTLKWHYVANKGHVDPYVTVKGIILSQGWSWSSTFRPHHVGDIEQEMRRFDDWVGWTYANDASVQG